MSRIAPIASLVLGAALLATGPAPARGDVVRLRTGETIKGRVVAERTNEQVLVVEDYLSGANRELAWDAVDPEDGDRVRRLLGIVRGQAEPVECLVVTYRLDDGSTTVIRGLFVKEEGGFLHLRNRSQKEPLRLETRRIASRTTGEGDPQEFQSPEELAEAERERLAPEDARTWLRVAQYCEEVGAYAAAKEAYELAAADETFLNRRVAQDGAARVDSILRDKEAVDTILTLKTAMGAAQWKRVREGIEGFATKHPTAGEPVRKKLEDLKKEFGERRARHYAGVAGRRLEPIVRNALKKRVAPKDAEYAAVQAWVRKDAAKEAFEALLAEMQKTDPAVTEAEAKAFWDARPKRVWRTAKYGSGTRFVDPPKLLPKTGVKQPAQQQKSGQPAPVLKVPEPPSQAEWWRALGTEERQDYWWAVFVEKSTLFEVDPKHGRIPCTKCNGDGTSTILMSNGLQATYLCERCAGARFDQTVRYR